LVYYYEWEWLNRTEEPQYTDRRFTDEEIDDIFDKVKYTLIITHTQDFVNKMREAGYNINVTSIEPIIALYGPEEELVYYPMGPVTVRYKYYLEYGARVKFTSDRPLEESPIAPAVAAVLDFVILIVIGALATSLVLYFIKEVIESSKTKKSVIRKYDPQTGQVTEENVITEEAGFFTGLTGLGIVILLIILALAFARREERK
jgi:hypothetical protein